MRKSRYQVPIKKNQTFALNITSMTDMFTILLVFLLQTFAANDVQIDPIDGVRLPSSITDRNPINGVKVSVSGKELKFDQKVVALVKDQQIEASAIDPHDLNFIKPLFDELKKLNTSNEALAKTGNILLQADQELPYATLRKIMYTASMAGFPNLKLVTTVSE